MQIDNLSELEKNKRPTEEMIWEGTPEDIERWLDRVLRGKETKDLEFTIREDEID